MGMPSVDWLLVRARLNHMVMVLRAPSASLRTLLAARGPHGERLPWVRLIIEDMRALRSFHLFKLQELGDP